VADTRELTVAALERGVSRLDRRHPALGRGRLAGLKGSTSSIRGRRHR
jgi:hypothetical protein